MERTRHGERDRDCKSPLTARNRRVERLPELQRPLLYLACVGRTTLAAPTGRVYPTRNRRARGPRDATTMTQHAPGRGDESRPHDDVGQDSDSQPIDASRAEIYEILGNTRRRLALLALDEAGTLRLTNLAEHVAAWEYDCQIRELDGAQYKRVYVALRQSHLEPLAEAGLVEVDDRMDEVAPTDATTTVAGAIDDVDARLAGGEA